MARSSRPTAPAELRGTVADDRGLLWEVWIWPPHEPGHHWRQVKLVAVTSSGRPSRRKYKASYRLGWDELGCLTGGRQLDIAYEHIPAALDAVEKLFS